MKQISPARINGALGAPASKSCMQRALLMASLADGTSRILNPAKDNDSRAAMSAVVSLGALVEAHGEFVSVTGGALPRKPNIFCAESGFLLRAITPICALFAEEFQIEAGGSLLSRPVSMMQEALVKLGANFTSSQDKLPLKVKGPLHAATLELEAETTSQFLSGLLMALPLCTGNSELLVRSLASRPYVELTLEMLRQFSVQIETSEDYSRFFIPGGQRYKPTSVKIEADWSSAAYLLVAGAIAGEVTVSGLNFESLQADKAILEILEKSGAGVTRSGDSVTVKQAELRSFEIDARHFPDLVPALAVLACNASGRSRIFSVGRLKAKESSRAEVITAELGKLGAKLQLNADTLEIDGSEITGGSAETHNDHRIAMALALAALNARNAVNLDDTTCVAKSYPAFFSDLEQLMEPL